MSIDRIDGKNLVSVEPQQKRQNANDNTTPPVSPPVSIYCSTNSYDNKTYDNTKTQGKCLDKAQRAKIAKELRARFEKTKKEQAFIGNCWDGIKNFFGKDTGSEHVENQIKAFEKGLISEKEAEQVLKEYQTGQEEVVDVTADITAGVAALGIYTAAIIAAPFSGGTSIAVGFAAATASGAAIKTGIKYADASAKGKEYDSVGYDLATGAFSGVLAPITGGVGGAVGKSVATKLGVQAISETGKAMTGNTLKAGAYNMLFNPTGYKYAGGSMLKRATAFGAECAADGAVGGSVDNMFRAALNGEDISEAGVNGFFGGLVLAPAIGGGIKGTGKVVKKVTNGVLNIKTPEIKVNEIEVEIRKEVGTTKTGKADARISEYDVARIINVTNESTLEIAKKLIRRVLDSNEKNIDWTEIEKIILLVAENPGIKELAQIEINAKPRFNLNDLNELVKFVNESNMPLVKELAQIEIKGEPRFNLNDLKDFVRIVNETNMPLVKELAQMEINGEPRFNLNDLKDLVRIVNETNMPLVKELAEIEINGKPRFIGYSIASLIEVANEANMPLIREFAQVEINGKPRFLDWEIANLVKIANETNMQRIRELIQMKTSGEPSFSCLNIERLLEITNEENMPYIRELAQMETKNGNPIFWGWSIARLIEIANETNIPLIKEFAQIETKDGQPMFDGNGVASLVRMANKANMPFLKELIQMEINGKPRFSSHDIVTLVYIANKTNMPILKELIQMEMNGKPRFSSHVIARLVYIANKTNMPFIKELAQMEINGQPRFKQEEIVNILNALNETNMPFIKEFLSMELNGEPRFDARDLVGLLRVVNKFNMQRINEFIKMEVNGKPRFDGWGVSKLVEIANEENMPFIKEFAQLETKDGQHRFNGNDVAELVKVTNKANMPIIKELAEMEINGKPRFISHGIEILVEVANETNMPIIKKLAQMESNGIPRFYSFDIADISKVINESNILFIEKLMQIESARQASFSTWTIITILKSVNETNISFIEKLAKNPKFSPQDLCLAITFDLLRNVKNINEIPISMKKDLLRRLVSANVELFAASPYLKEMYPLLPTTKEEYCLLLPALVRSLGVETEPLAAQTVKTFNTNIESLSAALKKISDEDFSNLNITQTYSKNDFISKTLELTKDLEPRERQKVYDYFGFEITEDGSIYGYPVNLNNGKKLAEVTDEKTKMVIEQLRPEVVRFTEHNPIRCNNKNVEVLLNEIVLVLPELRTQIGKAQHKVHSYDVFTHSLKVMQKLSQDPNFENLNESDKKLMMLAALLHDITKAEGVPDKTHAKEGAFDAFFIAKKFGLTKEEEIKLHALVAHHEWLEYVNTAKTEDELNKRLNFVAYDLRNDNLFEMALMFTHADLKSVKNNDSFHNTNVGKARTTISGTQRSFGDSAEVYAAQIRKNIAELKKSQPILPTTKIPETSRINSAITHVNPDGSTNIKGVYKDKDGLIIIKFNEVEDWEAIGFAPGSTSRGIKTTLFDGKEVDTGNIKFIVHGLDYENQLAKFDAFSLVDSDALLSVSYTERPETKFRFFRTQGVILDVDTKHIHGGGNTDSGSGCGKNIDEFKTNYIFGGEREADRLYISNLIKEATGMDDEAYIAFQKQYENKSFSEIQPQELREKIIKIFASINSNTRDGNREYNEMYISNPNRVSGVFVYPQETNREIGNPVEFLHSESSADNVNGRTSFLRNYAIERNIPLILFGD